MKLLILGAGNAQISAIKTAKQMGHMVIISDYLDNPSGKKFADYHEQVSTFNIKENIKVAKNHNIDGVMTIGTDQPVYTVSVLAEKLNLPYLINAKTAKAVTNKRVMKRIFKENKIPTCKFKLLKRDFEKKEIREIDFPAVLKPLDSQGQRGVFKINSLQQIYDLFPDVIKHSREDEILLEEYYDSKEITVSGWVDNKKLHILTVTDRVTYEDNLNIGICTAHIFPSRYLDQFQDKIIEISEKIVEKFKIENGPIYFQFLVGKEGIKVNEIACRIGGAYEAVFMPIITDIDLLKMVINSSLGEKINTEKLKKYNLLENNNWLSVQLFFARKGRIKNIENIDKIKKFKDVIEIKVNYKKGDVIPQIKNAKARAGYFIVKAKSKVELKDNIKKIYDYLSINNEKNENLIMRKAGESF